MIVIIMIIIIIIVIRIVRSNSIASGFVRRLLTRFLS